MKLTFNLYYNSTYVACIARRRNNANTVFETVTWIGSPVHSLFNYEKRMARICLFSEVRRRASHGWQVLSDIVTWMSSKSSSVKRAQCDYRGWVTVATCIVLLFALQKVLIISPIEHKAWSVLIDFPKMLIFECWTSLFILVHFNFLM